jgi:transposase-like protein
MTTISFARDQFPPDIIRHAVWLYLRFTLSFRDVEDLLAEAVALVGASERARAAPTFQPTRREEADNKKG